MAGRALHDVWPCTFCAEQNQQQCYTLRVEQVLIARHCILAPRCRKIVQPSALLAAELEARNTAQGDSGGMAKSSVGRLQNLSVSVQRRWNNVLSDATRQVLRV